MIIAIDGYEANVSERVGIGRYAFEVIKHLYEECKRQKVNGKRENSIIFRVYLPSAPFPDMPPQTDWWQYRIIWPKKFWTLFGLPFALAMDEPKSGVIFSPTHYVSRFTNLPRVMSIMDVSYLHYPDLFRPGDLYQLTRWTAYSVVNVAKILTISEFSKNAIIKAYGVPPEKIVMTYPGLTTMSKGKFPMSNVLGKYNIKSPYILSVGTLQPRKNYVRLIEAFSMVRKTHPKLELVIVGKKGWLYEEILAAPKTLGVEGSVNFLDFVKDEDLPALYRDAVCLALPSLYEGFGLPVLEAMSAGTIVVTSNVSSLPEVGGKAGIYVDPLNVESITKGLLQAIGEKGTAKGKARVAVGKEQAAQFSWEKTARQTLRVLEEIGNAS